MSSPTLIRLATRGSALALWQADRVADLIRQYAPDADVQKVVVTTRPDRLPDKPLAAMGGDKGLFVKEVEQAILDGRADAAIHSLKDVPVEESTPGLSLVAFPERSDPHDVFISRNGASLQDLPAGATVATSALRRQSQVLRARPVLKVCGVRGNVENRLRKLMEGEFDAIIMAAAGLMRLGLQHHITQVLPLEEFLPAPGQGILVVQARESDGREDLWAAVDDAATRLQAETEREVARRLGASCHSACGCYLQIQQNQALLRAMVARPEGTSRITSQHSAPLPHAAGLAAIVAGDLLARGAATLL